jgi:hypothetical protein
MAAGEEWSSKAAHRAGKSEWEMRNCFIVKTKRQGRRKKDTEFKTALATQRVF